VKHVQETERVEQHIVKIEICRRTAVRVGVVRNWKSIRGTRKDEDRRRKEELEKFYSSELEVKCDVRSDKKS